jgi:hypothetical protein
MNKGSDYDIDKFDLEFRKQELIKQGQDAARGFGAYNYPIIPNVYMNSTTTQYNPQTTPEREVIDTDYEEVKPKELGDGKQTN